MSASENESTHRTALRVAVVGGGAAGYFAAIACAERNANAEVSIFEAAKRTLAKVRISGGGRCNVTNGCFDPVHLVKHYPRGHRELRGPFSRFQPRDTMEWFEGRGVRLKTEEDGRVFPVTDKSETITGCLEDAARDAGVSVEVGVGCVDIQSPACDDGKPSFELSFSDGRKATFDRLLLTTGGATVGHRFAETLGHRLAAPIPSLFTFKIDDPRIEGLAGTSFPDARLRMRVGSAKALEQRGPVLITHWGLSGPAVLKLSAHGARALHESGYKAELQLEVVPGEAFEEVLARVRACKDGHPKQAVASTSFKPVPRKFWRRLVVLSGIDEETTWANVSRKAMVSIARELTEARFEVTGKGAFKEEFVTCGGVDLKEVDLKTMQSRRCPGLYLAGEILDIDGLTGGFNLQSAWTTGWVAGLSIAGRD